MRIVDFNNIGEDHKAIAMLCVGMVEATSFEHHCLWQQFSPESPRSFKKEYVKTWEQRLSGCMFCVGMCGESPVNVEVSFARIDGKWVMFYDACSQVVDHRLVEAWRAKHMSHAVNTNANNFHIVLHHIVDTNKKA